MDFFSAKVSILCKAIVNEMRKWYLLQFQSNHNVCNKQFRTNFLFAKSLKSIFWQLSGIDVDSIIYSLLSKKKFPPNNGTKVEVVFCCQFNDNKIEIDYKFISFTHKMAAVNVKCLLH